MLSGLLKKGNNMEIKELDQYQAAFDELKKLEKQCSRCIESLFYYLPRTQNNFKAVETLNCVRIDVTKLAIHMLENIKHLEQIENKPQAMETKGG